MTKFADIRVGQVVRLSKKHGGLPRVVVAIGKYKVEIPKEPHTVKWKGYTYQPTRWFIDDPRLAQRTVVVMEVRPDEPPIMTAITVANIAAILPEREAVKWTNTVRSSVTGNRIRKASTERRREYESVVRSIYAHISGISADRMGAVAFYAPVRVLTDNPDFVERMALLWMQYIRSQGHQIIPGEDAEQTIDAYTDAMYGLQETSAEGVKAAVAKEQSYEDLTEESPEWLEPMRIDGKVVGLGS